MEMWFLVSMEDALLLVINVDLFLPVKITKLDVKTDHASLH